ncbi:STAS domain-containing protein [Rhodococcus kroppenstedtii]|uniref:Unannotated protein n=1 Tax=freshwater metagenome TaxID=449393 RepID=A0A6J7H5A8_9ZZZZ|nr:STAS domain-containing protein [Rhodococcus kroppenstedtii]MDV7199571.1 STAS domain-containing protein [Rhodococcus kroppenstedtii]MSX07861.1 anti-sigma factor antagonist [Actinomycetota bacterium]
MVEQSASGTFDLGVTERDGVVIVSVFGEVDLVTSHRLAATAIPAAVDAEAGLIIDATEVTFLSSSGLSVLLQAIGAVPAGARSAIVSTHPSVRRVITVSGLDTTIVTTPDVESALRAVRNPR